MSVQVTTQVGQVDANAGLTQNVTINAGDDGTSTTPTGAGLATPQEVAADQGVDMTGASSSTTSAWPTYIFIAALAFFALKKMGGK